MMLLRIIDVDLGLTFGCPPLLDARRRKYIRPRFLLQRSLVVPCSLLELRKVAFWLDIDEALLCSSNVDDSE